MNIEEIHQESQDPIFSNPNSKWGHLAQAGQEVTVLPVNRASILVEAFVQHSALAARHSIDAAICRCDAGSGQEIKTKSLSATS
jgi:hypothetical protein